MENGKRHFTIVRITNKSVGRNNLGRIQRVVGGIERGWICEDTVVV